MLHDCLKIPEKRAKEIVVMVEKKLSNTEKLSVVLEYFHTKNSLARQEKIFAVFMCGKIMGLGEGLQANLTRLSDKTKSDLAYR